MKNRVPWAGSRSPFGRNGQGDNGHFKELSTTSGESGGAEEVHCPARGDLEMTCSPACPRCPAQQLPGRWREGGREKGGPTPHSAFKEAGPGVSGPDFDPTAW